MQVRQSELDPSVTVLEVETGDAGPMVDLLETRGHGFTVLGIEQRMVVVDGRLRARLSRHHLLAIEAHEIGHLQTGEDEREADLAGIRLLTAMKQPMAARLLRARL
jgi:Zn-dependent protease with chaperone function